MANFSVSPKNDIEPHDEYSPACKCLPSVLSFANGNSVIVHNSFDGREGLELAQEVLNGTEPPSSMRI